MPDGPAGPWKGAWIRRGHDPRTDKDSLHYQTIQYDLPPDWYADVLHMPPCEPPCMQYTASSRLLWSRFTEKLWCLSEVTRLHREPM